MSTTHTSPTALVEKLADATDRHDIAGLVACFAPDFVNETPAHPARGFKGRDQVESNWRQIFGAVPDLRARVLRSDPAGNLVWTEWSMQGTRRDGIRFEMGGPVLFSVRDGVFTAGRFYMEPVDRSGMDATTSARVVTTGETAIP